VNGWLSARRLFVAAALLPVAAVCAALVTQHVFGMQPCPWCVLQRLIFIGISLCALLGLLAADLPLLRRLVALLMVGLAACGVSAALWQHHVASTSPSCNMTLADRIVGGLGIDALWPQVFAAYTSCADAAATLLGVPYEFYSLTLFVVLGAAAAAVFRRPPA
jgi:disulfide bond formation protein DsbB